MATFDGYSETSKIYWSSAIPHHTFSSSAKVAGVSRPTVLATRSFPKATLTRSSNPVAFTSALEFSAQQISADSLHGVIQDVVKQRKTDASFLISRERFNEVREEAAVGKFGQDALRLRFEWNKGLAHIRYPLYTHEFLQRLMWSFIHSTTASEAAFRSEKLLFGGSVRIELSGGGSREPDFSIRDESNPKNHPCPTAVFEVAVSQTHVDVSQKAAHYLGGTDGKVQVVVVVVVVSDKDRALKDVQVDVWEATDIKRATYSDYNGKPLDEPVLHDSALETEGPYNYYSHNGRIVTTVSRTAHFNIVKHKEEQKDVEKVIELTHYQLYQNGRSHDALLKLPCRNLLRALEKGRDTQIAADQEKKKRELADDEEEEKEYVDRLQRRLKALTETTQSTKTTS